MAGLGKAEIDWRRKKETGRALALKTCGQGEERPLSERWISASSKRRLIP